VAELAVCNYKLLLQTGHSRENSRKNGGGGIRTLVGGKPPETVFETVSSETTTRPEFGSIMRISVEHDGLQQGRGNGRGNEIGVKI